MHRASAFLLDLVERNPLPTTMDELPTIDLLQARAGVTGEVPQPVLPDDYFYSYAPGTPKVIKVQEQYEQMC